MESIADCEDTLRILTRGMAQLGDYAGASRNAALILSAKFRAKELELKGMNVDGDDAQRITLVTRDYAAQFQEADERAKQLAEEVDALKAQIAAMGGKDRPRPPRPNLN